MQVKDKKIAVIGFGSTGRAVVDFLLKKKADIIVFDEKSRSEFKELKKGVQFNFGSFDFNEIARSEVIIMSPGVSRFKYPQFKELDCGGREVISEIELAYRFFKGKLIAVTGTNGKSTTSELVHHLFMNVYKKRNTCNAGRKSYLLGNIGVPFISIAEDIEPDSYAVVEVSCFQLEEIKSFRGDYVILTNISEDHLDRYPSMDAYIKTRKNIFKNVTSDDKIIMNFDDDLTKKHFCDIRNGQNYWFSRSSQVTRGTYLQGNDFIFSDEKEISLRFFNLLDFSLIGLHNIENVLAAAIPALLEGMEISLICDGLKNFKGLPHRMELVANFDGVDFINDSKATNVDAVLKAVISLNSSKAVSVIMGGRDKGGDFLQLSKKKVLTDKIKLVVLMGEAAGTIKSALRGIVQMKEVADMKEAVRISFKEASKSSSGGVVLLSPGCASFDMFDSFEHRGDVFKKEVMVVLNESGRDTKKT